MSGEISKTLRTKLWSLRLQSKGDVNKHINDFTIYIDQLKELGREEREETLIDLFLDSIIDPKFEVTVVNCRLKDQITLFECFEAMRKYDNVIMRDSLANERNNLTSRRANGPTNRKIDKNQGNNGINTNYRPYKEWQKLSIEQRKAILKEREQHNYKKETNDSSSKPLNALGKQPTHLGQGGAPKKIRRLPEQDADIQDNTPQTMHFTLKDENQNS